MSGERTLRLVGIEHAPNQLHMRYALDGLQFTNTIWYADVDFDELARRFGPERLRMLLFHIAAFEINKVCSLMPTRLDWGPYRDLATPAFRALWETVFRHVWAQWRFENHAPAYPGPEQSVDPGARLPGPVLDTNRGDACLAFCGGGKDSLLAMACLSECGAPFGTLGYSVSCYGPSRLQHELIDRLVGHFALRRHHRQWVFDDLLDSPVLALRPDWKLKTLTAAETPSSVFAALPIVLQHDYRYVVLAHERSADAPQLVWDATGEAVNHQWGKSAAAEALLNNYIRQELIREFDYFSILKPIYDVAIFGALRGYEAAVIDTHSCNVAKPWCGRCAKCLYVWLGYTAFLEPGIVGRIFGAENLFDVPENEFVFRQLVGLESQLPFECIGEAQEAALLLLMARRKGFAGRAFEACRAAFERLDTRQVLDKYLAVDPRQGNVPTALAGPLKDLFQRKANATRRYAVSILGL